MTPLILTIMILVRGPEAIDPASSHAPVFLAENRATAEATAKTAETASASAPALSLPSSAPPCDSLQASAAGATPDDSLLCADAAGAASADSLYAELPVYTMPPVETTAPRYRPVPARPGARTVLDRAWLDRVDPVDMAQALLPVAGLRVTTMGDGMSRTVSLRGQSADRVAVLVDGRPLNTAQGGGVDLQPLDPDAVERVEVTRGAMGALYGPNALGGAVNLVRRNDRAPDSVVRFVGGTDGRGLVRARSGFATGRWTMEGSLRAETASPSLDDRTAHAEGTGGRARAAYHPGWAAALEASAEVRSDRRDVPGSRAFPTPEAERSDLFAELALGAQGIEANGVPGSWDLNFSRMSLDREYRDPGNFAGPVNDRHENRRVTASASWRVDAGAGSVIARTEAVRDRLHSTTDGDVGRDRAAGAVYLQQAWRKWGTASALRVDALEGFAPHVTGRFSLSRTLTGSEDAGSWLAARAGAGTSFRPPTFDDLFWPARASAAGNPDLAPERARDLDLGLELRAGDSRVQASGFWSEVRDLIQWSPGGDGVWRPHNVGEARLRGVEIDGSAAPAGWPVRLDAAFTLLDAQDATGDPVTGGKALVGRASRTLFVEASWTRGAWTLASGARSVSRVPLTAANTKWQDGYTLWHARIRRQVSRELRLELEGQNLFDTDYEDLRGYAVPGRQVLLGLRFTPGGGAQ